MIRSSSDQQNDPGDCVEAKIALHDYRTSEALKKEIRRQVVDFDTRGWELDAMSSKDGFIFLTFKEAPTK